MTTDALIIRPLMAEDIPNLPQIRPTYQSATILVLEKQLSGIEARWTLTEKLLPTPFDKGAVYDFNAYAQQEVRDRFSHPEDCLQCVAVDPVRSIMVGLVEVEIHHWNNTALLASLMIDVDYRRQGLGHRLWDEAVGFARRRSVRALMLETQNTNVSACRFYARMGCTLVGFNEALYNIPITEVALYWSYPLK